ncbi:unnamed protein product, partial [Ectocarpus sp. 12 AP-2014]
HRGHPGHDGGQRTVVVHRHRHQGVSVGVHHLDADRVDFVRVFGQGYRHRRHGLNVHHDALRLIRQDPWLRPLHSPSRSLLWTGRALPSHCRTIRQDKASYDVREAQGAGQGAQEEAP